MFSSKKKALAGHGASAAGHNRGSPDDHVHVMPLPLYFGVFGALLVLTVITVGVSVIGLPPLLSILVAMAVATVKATLVVLFFMHLRYENTFYAFIFGASLFFVALFFVFTLADMEFRGYVNPEEETAVWRNEQLEIKKADAAKAGEVPSAPASNTDGAPPSAPASQPSGN